MTSGRAGTCPSCGAPLEFAVGSSRAAVCKSCRSLVARGNQDFEKVGEVADLIVTGSRLSLGVSGRFNGERFAIIGRLQLDWGSGVWDEWYVTMDGGERWGWLAEARGVFYLTFLESAATLPSLTDLAPGKAVFLDDHGRFVVTDIKEAKLIACEGELPETMTPGAMVRSADLEGPEGAFATIDYGSPGDSPQLFAGSRVTLEELDLSGAAPAPDSARPEGLALTCSNCGAPVTLRVPALSARAVCASCNALLDNNQGSLRLIEILELHREKPAIPLGTKGTLRGAEVIVVGWIQRRLKGSSESWEDLLLYHPGTTSFSWLVLSDGHWSHSTPISAGDVRAGRQPVYRGKSYRLFSWGESVVSAVLGEIYWQVQVGEETKGEDYVAPPHGLSMERNDEEINWSHLVYLEPAEVAKAFAIPRLAEAPRIGVGPLQPWPYQAFWRRVSTFALGGLAAAFVLFAIFVLRPSHPVFSHTFTPDELSAHDPTLEPGEELPPESKVFTYLSEPFPLSGNRALAVDMSSDVSNSWVFVEGGVVEESSGETVLFGLETAYFYGNDDGILWNEGSREAGEELAAPRRGTYVLRADVQWDPKSSPPTVKLEVREGGFSGLQFLILLGVVAWPLLFLIHRVSFERRRWEQSDSDGGS